MAKKRRRKRRKGLIVLKVFLCLILLTIVGGLAVFFLGGYYSRFSEMKSDADALVSASTAETFVPTQTGEVFASNGELLSEIQSEKDSSYMTYDEIPEIFVQTMVSIEDKKYYSHNGVDYKAMLRALKELIQNRRITQGGSTITMQLARGIFLTNEVSWERKVKEIFISWDLEQKYSKDEIMEFYLNNIYFANGYYGIKAASNGYFNKEPGELDVSQVAFLCAIPNSPTYYDPIVNSDNTIVRRDLILSNMLSDGVISQDEYDSAIAETITLDLSGNVSELLTQNNYTVTYAYHCATEALMELQGFVLRYDFASDKDRESYEASYNEMYSQCEQQLYSGGYKIYTSFDMDKQEELQNSLDETLSVFTEIDEDGEYKMQGAAVCIDNETGRVVAMVGGRSTENSTTLALNRAYQSHRQPGSSIKPLVVYTPAFDRGDYFPSTEVEDQEIEDGPKNAGGSYQGEMPLSEAVQRSLNTVAWQVYEDITPSYGLQYLKDMNFSKIVDADNTQATSLGGFTYGVEPVEMAAGFASLENDGVYRQPTCIERIENYKEETIYVSDQAGTQTYKKNSARMMVSVLEGVLEESWGTGRSLKLNNMPAAGKTGTTDEAKDGWFCGFTHYYTTSVWVGCDTPEAVKNLQGATYPGQIWKSFMNTIHEDLDPVEFEDYDHTAEDLADNKYSDDDDDDEEADKTDELEVVEPDDMVGTDSDTDSRVVIDITPDSNSGNNDSTNNGVDSNNNTDNNNSNNNGGTGSDDNSGNNGGSDNSGGSGDNGGRSDNLGGDTPGDNTDPGGSDQSGESEDNTDQSGGSSNNTSENGGVSSRGRWRKKIIELSDLTDNLAIYGIKI